MTHRYTKKKKLHSHFFTTETSVCIAPKAQLWTTAAQSRTIPVWVNADSSFFSSLYIRKSRSGILRLIVHSSDMWAGALWKLIPRTWDEENPPQWQHFPCHYLGLMSKKHCCNVGFGVPRSINLPRQLWKGTCMGLVNSLGDSTITHSSMRYLLIVLLYKEGTFWAWKECSCYPVPFLCRGAFPRSTDFTFLFFLF